MTCTNDPRGVALPKFRDRFRDRLARGLCAVAVLLIASGFARPGIAAEEEGFMPLFDGKTLHGWNGNEKIFRIVDEAIVAGSLSHPVERNEFLCTDRSFTDFELRLQVKLVGEGANAGVQFRTERIPNHHEVRGYQADAGDGWWGKLYDESRRNRVLADLPSSIDVAKLIHHEDWNDYIVRCEGSHIQIWVNGQQTVDFTETDPQIDRSGVIAVQIHGGPASEAWYRQIRLKPLSSSKN